MRELTLEEKEIQTKRRKAFRSFVAGIKPAIIEFAGFVGVENPQTAVDKPEKFLQVLELFLKNQDISELDREDQQTFHTMLMYYVGELLLYRHGGIWFLNENPDSESFLHYVVGYFERDGVSKELFLDPFNIIQGFMQTKIGRSLTEIIREAEENIYQKNE